MILLSILITRPEHDLQTFYLSRWIEDVIISAEKNNIKVVSLNRENACRKNIENMLKKIPVKFVIFNGHGSDEEICGHNNEVVISIENIDMLKSKIVYSIACRSAAKLGVEAIENGAFSFIGYSNDFMIYTNTNKTATPLKDEFARPFLESSNKIGLSLIKGFSTGKAIEESQKSFEEWALYYLRNDLIESPFILPALLWDMECQILIGDKDSRLS